MNNINVTGIILKSEPIGDYDKRLVILTKERGKISAFARGALRPNSRNISKTEMFTFAIFELYVGSSSYSVNKIDVQNYFEEFRNNIDITFYGTYFLEIADYYARENTDNVALMRLLYRALTLIPDENYKKDFVKTVFEAKSIMLEGEFPDYTAESTLSDSAKRALSYIYSSKAENAFAFSLSDETFKKLKEYVERVCKDTFDREFMSLLLLEGSGQ